MTGSISDTDRKSSDREGGQDSRSGPDDTRLDGELRGEDAAVRLPIDGTLDLHAFRPADVRSVVEEYVNEARAAGLREIRIVHGRGTGVLRGIVQSALEAHPLVESFWDDTDAHLGATWARLGD